LGSENNGWKFCAESKVFLFAIHFALNTVSEDSTGYNIFPPLHLISDFSDVK